MPDIVNSGRGVMGFLRSLAGDLDREDAASQDIANYQQALRKNMLDNWYQGPPQQFYDQAQAKLQDPAFHSRVVGDVVKAVDPGVRDAGADAAATVFAMNPKGMAASYLAGLIADPSAANFANTAFQIADPMQASPGGGFSLAGTPIARIPAGEQALARLKTYARDASDIQKQLFHGVINARDRLFHATDAGGFKGILESGEISPNPWLHQGLGTAKQKQLMQSKHGFNDWEAINPNAIGMNPDVKAWKSQASGFTITQKPNGFQVNDAYGGDLGLASSMDDAKKWAQKNFASLLKDTNPDAGVSVSRVPRISPKSSKAISFVLDPNEMPPMRPLAEQGYQKTKPTFADYASYTAEEQAEYNALSAKLSNLQSSQKTNVFTDPPTPEQQAVVAKMNEITKTAQQRAAEEARNKAEPNKNFEYELRTFNESIPLEGRHGRPVATEVWVDKSALDKPDVFNKNVQMQLTQHPEYQRFIAEEAAANPDSGWPWENPQHQLQVDDNIRFFLSSHPHATDILKDLRIAELRQQAAERGLPLRVFPSGPAMHAARVGQYASDPAAATSFGVWGEKKAPVPTPEPPKSVLDAVDAWNTVAKNIQNAAPKPAAPVWWPDYVVADYEAGLLNFDAAQAKAKAHSHGLAPNKDPLTVTKGGGKKAKKKLADIPLTPEPPPSPANW